MPEFVNRISIETIYGFKNINLFYGDILNSKDELLVISTHANPEMEMDGLLVNSLKKRFDVDFKFSNPLIIIKEQFGTFKLDKLTNNYPFKQILYVRIPGAHNFEDENKQLEIYKDALWSVFGSVAALELKNETFESMSLPLLAGQRYYPVLGMLNIFLTQATNWLKISRYMNNINFYIYDFEHSKKWDEAINTTLGRNVIAKARNEIIRALCAEIIDKIKKIKIKGNGIIVKNAILIENAIKSDNVNLQLVSIFSRSLIEAIVQEICINKSIVWRGNLLNDIEALKSAAIIAPWMISHFHTLRILGNASVHVKNSVNYIPENLHEEDLIPVLVSLLRVISFYLKWD